MSSNIEGSPELEVPTISVDRALGHFSPHVSVDVVSLYEFYDSLPHENKPPLSDLIIHLSAGTCPSKDYTALTRGTYNPLGSYDRSSSPELGETTRPTITMYMGSYFEKMSNGSISPEEVGGLLSEDFTHELTHYAQDDRRKMKYAAKAIGRIVARAELASLHFALGLTSDWRWIGGGTLTFAASEVLTDNNRPESWSLAAGVAGLIHLLRFNARAEQLREVKAETTQNTYEQEKNEQDARMHANRYTSIISFEFGSVDASLLRKISATSGVAGSRSARAQERHRVVESHKELSLSSPQTL